MEPETSIQEHLDANGSDNSVRKAVKELGEKYFSKMAGNTATLRLFGGSTIGFATLSVASQNSRGARFWRIICRIKVEIKIPLDPTKAINKMSISECKYTFFIPFPLFIIQIFVSVSMGVLIIFSNKDKKDCMLPVIMGHSLPTETASYWSNKWESLQKRYNT